MGGPGSGRRHAWQINDSEFSSDGRPSCLTGPRHPETWSADVVLKDRLLARLHEHHPDLIPAASPAG